MNTLSSDIRVSKRLMKCLSPLGKLLSSCRKESLQKSSISFCVEIVRQIGRTVNIKIHQPVELFPLRNIQSIPFVHEKTTLPNNSSHLETYWLFNLWEFLFHSIERSIFSLSIKSNQSFRRRFHFSSPEIKQTKSNVFITWWMNML